MDIKNTKTEENLRAALAGESIARNKYTYFASAAKKSGEPEIAAAFERMAINEMTHARLWFELLYGKPEAADKCLQIAASGEYSEWHDMYPKFAEQARADGLENIAVMFEHVADIERNHEKQFMTLLIEMKNKNRNTTDAAPEATPVQKVKKQGYRCQFCGAIFDHRPDVCSTCEAIGSFEPVEYYE